jgi:glutathione S-transferase
MTVRVYHTPPSRSSRVLWLLEEVGADYDVTHLTREQKQEDAHKRVHPLGKVPAIDEGQGPIIESLAICLHLADQHPEANLNWPLGTRERALVYQWATFPMTEIEPVIIEAWRYEDLPDVVAKAHERFAAAMTVVENALEGREFIVGERFSVADIVLGAVIGFAGRRGLLAGYPNCAEYAARLEARPARQRADAVAP